MPFKEGEIDLEAFGKMESLQAMKTVNQLVVEMEFDPTSKFLAVGTADSAIKIYDALKGFQTHSFNGHRGLILGLKFLPSTDSLKLLSTAEDFTIKVWDLVLKKDVAVMKPKSKEDGQGHRTTSMLFTADGKTLITAGLDGCIHFWNVVDNFKLVSSISASSLGALRYEEIMTMVYLSLKDDPCLVLGGHSGYVSVYSIKKQKIVFTCCESSTVGAPDA